MSHVADRFVVILDAAAAFVMDLTAKGLPMLAARAKPHMDFL